MEKQSNQKRNLEKINTYISAIKELSNLDDNEKLEGFEKAVRELAISAVTEDLNAKIQEAKDIIEILNKRIASLDNECKGYLKEKLSMKRAKEDAEEELQDLTIENKIMQKELDKRDYVYVKQFNNLYWGDNYPALKVLFDFLQKMSCLDINWSYFCFNMCLENSEAINLKTTMLYKKEIGYLLAHIRKFFNTEIKGSSTTYKSWLQEKILIDNLEVEDDFIKKYVRNYKTGTPLQSDKVEIIDGLMLKIAERYN
ncbi:MULTISPECIES: hypothetical protein [unclassified Arenibacter]|uniref:hypothetical protein n=1 Tax=unclassified Arenibacter TaxID=2615047 RepID=UPI000E349BEA|nr:MULTISPECIES: hypothetical protein [unclassified Arenibacter]MCM4162985.1 hypothetical protein [Arenibacter sp. A80]RFT57024.1 hypothetical protein D0S24_05200 [Arenibacter sp. P308M17]